MATYYESEKTVDTEEVTEVKVLKDTGARTTFETGSQKEIVEGRGRFDLMPLKVVSDVWESIDGSGYWGESLATFIGNIYKVVIEPDTVEQYNLLIETISDYIQNTLGMVPAEAMRQLSILYEQGANKYAARDWELGRPMEVFLNSALRHAHQFINNETDENHGIQALWNLVSCADTIRRMPSQSFHLKEVVE